MNEQLVSELIAALTAQTRAQQEQTTAINKLAESNESLCEVILQSLAEDDLARDPMSLTYLDGKPRG